MRAHHPTNSSPPATGLLGLVGPERGPDFFMGARVSGKFSRCRDAIPTRNGYVLAGGRLGLNPALFRHRLGHDPRVLPLYSVARTKLSN